MVNLISPSYDASGQAGLAQGLLGQLSYPMPFPLGCEVVSMGFVPFFIAVEGLGVPAAML
jgi:hypothetical protein